MAGALRREAVAFPVSTFLFRKKGTPEQIRQHREQFYSYNLKIMLGNNQYLTFNPKRQFRTEKQPRQGLQLRFKTSQYSAQNQYRHLSINQSKRKNAVEKKFDPYHNPRQSYNELSQSNYSQRYKQEMGKVQSERKKDDILKRVKQLQNIVLPLVERDDRDEDSSEVGWESKIERKMLRIQSGIDSVRKEWQIQMQKKILRFDEKLEERYMELKAKKNRFDSNYQT